MKYFPLGAFASAFFLFGTALVYGYAGTVSLGGIADAIAGRSAVGPAMGSSTANKTLLLTGLAMPGAACCSRSAPSPSTPGRRTSAKGRRSPAAPGAGTRRTTSPGRSGEVVACCGRPQHGRAVF